MGTSTPSLTLHPTAARPDQSTNAFCLSCHLQEQGPSGLKTGLDIAALSFHSNTMRMSDPRRQPLNVPATIHGVVPQAIPSGNQGFPIIPAFSTLGGNGIFHADENSSFLIKPEADTTIMDLFFDENLKLRPNQF